MINPDNIKFVTTKNGTERAVYWSMRALRWLPIKLAEAKRIVGEKV